MIVLDTTVLMYALGADHPLRDPCRRIVAAVTEGRLAATTTVEVLQQFAHVHARRRDRQIASTHAVAYATLLGPLVRPDRDDVVRGLALFASSASLGSFDAVLAATVLGAPHLTALVSADRGFAAVADLRYVDPADEVALASIGV